MQNLRILFAGGGTGGHLYSGIAVADRVRDRFNNSEILFVGTPYGLEKEIVPQCGYSLELMGVTRLKGSGLSARIKTLWGLPKAYRHAKKILKKFKPHVVLGIGGYASGPMTLAAHRGKIFTAIIEQNSYPGLTNRILGRFVNRVFISFNRAREFFKPEKTFLTGNPVRKFPSFGPTESIPPLRIFVLGGSQGAHALNQAMIEALPHLKNESKNLNFVHQTGKNDLQEVRQAYEQSAISAEVFDFNNDLGPIYARCHLVISRAGAGTITELRLKGLPALLIPYPYAADDHQRLNAEEMVEAGAAELCLNENLSGDFLAQKIKFFLANPSTLKNMGKEALAQAKPKAADEVLDLCLKALK